MLHHAKFICLIFVVGALLLSTGCSKVTQENYDKISLGMGYDEVVAVLGSPNLTEDTMGAKNCVWGKDPKSISIKFVADKVAFYSSKGLK
jgi:hypothetical protein